jgi:hypothetical protein
MEREENHDLGRGWPSSSHRRATCFVRTSPRPHLCIHTSKRKNGLLCAALKVASYSS